MRIAIDVSQIVYETGVSVYTRNLVENLLKLDRKNDYVLFAGSLRRRRDFKEFFDTKVFLIPPLLADLLWNRLHVLPIEKLIGKVDVFHSSDWTQPSSRAFKITTIHDLTPIKFPQWTNPRVASVHKRRLRWVKREVDRIIVPSNSTKEDMVALGFAAEKITVIGEACDPAFKVNPRFKASELKRKYGIVGEYLLAVGASERKNTLRIVEAFKRIRAEIGVDNLVIIGSNPRGLESEDGVVYAGHVPEEELPAFYCGAKCLVYASLYEGFGLPILEAFASGTPVVTSSISSMPEVAGSAAVLVNPKSIDSIVRGIKKAVREKDGLVKKGKERLKEFSWEKTARETLKVYMDL
jgi:glycosyltransferase involved in cell wall biosynthesis